MSELFGELLTIDTAGSAREATHDSAQHFREVIGGHIASLITPTEVLEEVVHKRAGPLDRSVVRAMAPPLLSGERLSRSELSSDVTRVEPSGKKERIAQNVKLIVVDRLSPKDLLNHPGRDAYRLTLGNLMQFLKAETQIMSEDGYTTRIRDASVEHLTLMQDAFGKFDVRHMSTSSADDLQNEIASYQSKLLWTLDSHPDLAHNAPYLAQKSLAERVNGLPGTTVPIYIGFSPPFVAQKEKPFIFISDKGEPSLYRYTSKRELEKIT